MIFWNPRIIGAFHAFRIAKEENYRMEPNRDNVPTPRRGSSQHDSEPPSQYTAQRWTLRISFSVAIISTLTLLLGFVRTSDLVILLWDCIAISIVIILLNTSDFMDRKLFSVTLKIYGRLIRSGLLIEEWPDEMNQF